MAVATNSFSNEADWFNACVLGHVDIAGSLASCQDHVSITERKDYKKISLSVSRHL